MSESEVPKSINGKNLKKKCGIVAPISTNEFFSADHWLAVKLILIKTAENLGYEAEMVSIQPISGIIQASIIANLRDNEVVICDLSGSNPNVMFELGLRLAFDMPTIVIQDEKTNYHFDISPLRIITYPSDLNYFGVDEFMNNLSEAILNTTSGDENSNYKTYLQHFGINKRVIKTDSVEFDEFVVDSLKNILANITSKPLLESSQIMIYGLTRNEYKSLISVFQIAVGMAANPARIIKDSPMLMNNLIDRMFVFLRERNLGHLRPELVLTIVHDLFACQINLP